MTTAQDIIALSLRNAGIVGTGQTALAQDVNDALTLLNDMIAQWQRKRWFIFHDVDVSKIGTGAQFYTIGPGQDFDTPRPDRLETGCFARLLTTTAPNQVDYSLRVLEAREDYAQIALKQLNSFPQYVFYDAAFPTGKIYVWPIPNNQYEIHLLVKGVLNNFPTLTTAFDLPPEFSEALRLNLITRLRSAYQMQPDVANDALAKAAMNTIKNANAQIPMLTVPAELRRPRWYNFWSDTMY